MCHETNLSGINMWSGSLDSCNSWQWESTVMHFQPGEGPSMGLIRDSEIFAKLRLKLLCGAGCCSGCLYLSIIGPNLQHLNVKVWICDHRLINGAGWLIRRLGLASFITSQHRVTQAATLRPGLWLTVTRVGKIVRCGLFPFRLASKLHWSWWLGLVRCNIFWHVKVCPDILASLNLFPCSPHHISSFLTQNINSRHQC